VALSVLSVSTAHLLEGLIVSDAVVKKNSAIELIKSVFVIPLVVGLVMGSGWGLVRLAAARQRESGKPDPQPAESGPDGALVLKIPFAQVTGEIHYGGGSHPLLANWKRADETVTWRFNVEKAGRYNLELDCACDAADAGSVVSIALDADSFQATIPNSGGAHTFKPVRVGTVNLASPGWRELRITPVKVAHNSVMVLRGVRLAPVGTSS
jgi:hypothetical protein